MSAHREQACAAPALPPDLATIVEGHDWLRDRVGESGGAVYRLHKAGQPSLYLKHGVDLVVSDLVDEMARLHWLQAWISVPRIRHFTVADTGAWLLSDAVPGRTAFQLLDSDPAGRIAVVDALAVFLGRLHAVPVECCPFNSDHRFRLIQAHERMAGGLVDTDEFDPERQGWSAEQVWAEMTRLLPFDPDPVVTHGDYSLDNVLLHAGSVSGCIDLGRAGIADRYQDLAIAWNCLGEFDGSLQRRFLQTYGIQEPDTRKLRFHLMLDEFF